ncbi:uncharacterized protein DFL_001537 [Arthrobotrys flagrans]|uniref:Phospholipase/carboxylesterase/thioesterase domain-containing protein n=1 Tax=Arthrobotrys flagrans TaxID=97331 RepID=A0A437A870_ARTFL|nr:hypothetical protein DFL_001537 [Arthrobotrys flagrans]
MEGPSESSVPTGIAPSGQVGSSGPLSTTTEYPEPFIINPTTSHTHTIILLHGRGSNGLKFGTEFTTSNTSTGETLQRIFPSTKWIFPTAKKRRAVLFKRMPINQWFDIMDINNQSYREHLQVDGLQETTEFLHSLIEQEIRNGIPVERIVVGGLSQGCASSLYAMLCYKWRLGGYIGMCGWLPFAEYAESFLNTSSSADGIEDDDIFGTSDDEEGTAFTKNEEADGTQERATKDPIAEAIGFLKDNISFPRSQEDKLLVLQTPVFLGHGVLDEKVLFQLGEQARDLLKGLGFNITWKGYSDLGHWYKIPDEIDHIRDFIIDRCSRY